MKILYKTRATATGGRSGHSQTDDGALSVDLATPDSGKTGNNPEQLFATGYAAYGVFLGKVGMTRQAVAKHLALLEAANLVATVWQGREKLHYLNPVPLHEIYERWISKYERHRLQALSDLKKGLEENPNQE